MRRAVVLMPSFGSCPVRARNEAFVIKHYAAAYGIPVVLGSGISRCHAVNDAARKAAREHPSRDVFVLADNDLIPDEIPFRVGYDLALRHAAVTPHDRTLLLTQEASRTVLDGGPYGSHEGARSGSLSYVLVRREVYGLVNGMDEKFIGWGPEDKAFLHSIERQAGKPLGLSGYRWHLWHPIDPTKRDPNRVRVNRRRFRQYELGDVERVRALAREYGVWHERADGPTEHRRPPHDPGVGRGDSMGAGRHPPGPHSRESPHPVGSRH